MRDFITANCVRDWFPSCCSTITKTQGLGAALTFLRRNHYEGDFFNKISTGDKAWVHYENQEIKEQSKQWMHSYPPPLKKHQTKFKQTFSIRKCMVTVFCARKEFYWWKSWNVARTSLQPRCLHGGVQKKRRKILSGIFLLLDNARTHTTTESKTLLQVAIGKNLITLYTARIWLSLIIISFLTWYDGHEDKILAQKMSCRLA